MKEKGFFFSSAGNFIVNVSCTILTAAAQS